MKQLQEEQLQEEQLLEEQLLEEQLLEEQLELKKTNTSLTKQGKSRLRNAPVNKVEMVLPELLAIVVEGIVPLNVITRAIPQIYDGIIYKYYDQKFLAFYKWDFKIRRVGLYDTSLEAVQALNWYLLENSDTLYGKHTPLLLNPEVDYEREIKESYPQYIKNIDGRYTPRIRLETDKVYSVGTYNCLEVAVRAQNNVKDYLNKKEGREIYKLFKLNNGEIL